MDADGLAVADLLRRERRAAGLSQAELAHASDISQAMLSRWERGRRAPSIATINKVLAAMGRQLLLATEPLWADVDRAIDRLAAMSITDRVAQPSFQLGIWREWLAPVPHLIDGAFAAVLQGVPLPVKALEVLVPESDLDGLAAALAGITNLRRWSQNWQDWGYASSDPREPGPLRWNCVFGELRVRLVTALPDAVQILVGDERLAVAPVFELDVSDPRTARLIDRARQRGGARATG
ncbi:MAG: helix-turn-helix domain-containing protein [Mycobacteriales bacterium]